MGSSASALIAAFVIWPMISMRMLMRLLGSMSVIVVINPENGPCVTCAWLPAWSWLACVSLVLRNMLCLSHRSISASTISFGTTLGSAPRRTKRATPRVLFTWRHGPWSGWSWTNRYPENSGQIRRWNILPFRLVISCRGRNVPKLWFSRLRTAICVSFGLHWTRYQRELCVVSVLGFSIISKRVFLSLYLIYQQRLYLFLSLPHFSRTFICFCDRRLVRLTFALVQDVKRIMNKFNLRWQFLYHTLTVPDAAFLDCNSLRFNFWCLF